MANWPLVFRVSESVPPDQVWIVQPEQRFSVTRRGLVAEIIIEPARLLGRIVNVGSAGTPETPTSAHSAEEGR
jgi:hypothetical protein